MINQDEIYRLILSKREGSYWDFKRQWYDISHETDLLHDIICMANNIENRDSYIIIGIDEEKDFLPVDISNDTNSKNTQKLVDFLRDKKFAGDFRPEVSVERIFFNGCAIDVIVIFNSIHTPFYLKQEYKGVHANNIYTRIQDSNTPIDRTADMRFVELLWKKRFGLIQTPINRFKEYLNHKDDWSKSPGFDELKYHKLFPEFTIGYSMDDPFERDGYEFYLFSQTDNKPHWTIIQLRYYQTLLFQMDGIILDGGRHFSPCPLTDGISLTQYLSWDVVYRYFIKDSLEFIIHDFYLDNNSEAMWSDQRFMNNILLFETETEHNEFNEYIKVNWSEERLNADNFFIPNIPKLENYNISHFIREIKTAQILNEMLNEFRELQNNK